MRKKLIFYLFILISIGIIFFGESTVWAIVGDMPTKRQRLLDRSRNQSNANRPSVQLYQKIYESFLAERYTEADRHCSEYLALSGEKPNKDDVLYLQALTLFKLGRRAEGRQKLGQLEASFSSSNRKASASATIADSYYDEGDYRSAEMAYRQTLERYPQSDQSTYIRSRLNEMSSKSESASAPMAAQVGTYSVQVAAFSKEINAQRLVKKLNTRGHEASYEKVPRRKLYRVRVGRLSTRREAESLNARLRAEGLSGKIVLLS